jgi:hypothetical protein
MTGGPWSEMQARSATSSAITRLSPPTGNSKSGNVGDNFSGLLSCSLSRAQTRSLVSGFRRIELQAIRRTRQEAETEDAG